MSTQWNSASATRLRILEKLRRYFDTCLEHGDAPRLEQLEGRVLLSANPLSELTGYQASGHDANDQVTHMPLTAGRSVTPAGVENSPAALADVPDAVGPTIDSITTSKQSVRTFDPVYFTINASADSGIAKYRLTVNGKSVSILSTGRSSSASPSPRPASTNWWPPLPTRLAMSPSTPLRWRWPKRPTSRPLPSPFLPTTIPFTGGMSPSS